MKQRELFGQLSLIDRQLLLAGVPLPDGQLVAFKYGESSYYLPARVTFHPNGY